MEEKVTPLKQPFYRSSKNFKGPLGGGEAARGRQQLLRGEEQHSGYLYFKHYRWDQDQPLPQSKIIEATMCKSVLHVCDSA